MKEKSKNKQLFVALVIVLGFFFLFSALKSTSQNGNNIFGLFESSSEKSEKKDENVVVKIVSEESQVIEVVKNSAPAVVSIIASADVPKLEVCYDDQQPRGFNDDFFGDFFNFRVPRYCERGTETKRVGAGSGFLVSEDGYILTNKHVVTNEEAEYSVILNDEQHKGESVRAEVIAKDPSNDIAILKIDMQNLPHIPFGDSEKIQVGQTAIAIGYALGEFENTVSKGVVSGLARSITASGSSFGQLEQLEGVIQTDAAINPGNSGGPLLDSSGRVIGMNVATASADNISFAIPINEIKRVYDDVRETGKIQRAFLGVRYMIINKDLQERNDLPVDYGALIVRGEQLGDLAIVPGSPADKAGIVENDIILEINGQKIDVNNSLGRTIAKLRIGDEVQLKIYHKGEEKTVTVTLEERDKE